MHLCPFWFFISSLQQAVPFTRRSPVFRSLFFFQAEDGIRDRNVTGVQTCALPIFTQLGAKHPAFEGLTTDVEPDQPNYVGTHLPIARYHSLGCVNLPDSLQALGFI